MRGRLSWALADQALVSAANFLVNILLARSLGLAEYGLFALVSIVLLLVTSLQAALLLAPMMSIGPKQSAEEAPAYYAALLVQQIALVAFTALAFALSLAVRHVVMPDWEAWRMALPLTAAAIAGQAQEFWRRYLFTRGRALAAFLNDGLAYGGRVALVLLLMPNGAGAERALWLLAAGSLLAAICAALRPGALRWEPGYLRACVARHWHFSKWLAATAVAEWLGSGVAMGIAGALLGVAAVGAINATQNIFGFIHILWQGLSNILPIEAARRFRQYGAAGLAAYLGRFSVIAGACTGLFAVAVAVAPELWLRMFLGGAQGGDAAAVLLVRLWALRYCVSFFRLPLRAGLGAVEHTRPLFLAFMAETLFAIALAYPFVAGLGASGVMLLFVGSALVNEAVMLAALLGWLRLFMLESDSTQHSQAFIAEED